MIKCAPFMKKLTPYLHSLIPPLCIDIKKVKKYIIKPLIINKKDMKKFD